jgi:hypothetical protein
MVVFFLLLAACAAAFVWYTSAPLPALVASHFTFAGAASGFMPRESYVAVTLAVAVGLPVLLAATTLVFGRPDARLRVPHADYWLARPQRDASVAFLRAHVLLFATMLLLFFCFAHVLVVQANTNGAAGLDSHWFLAGLGTFLVGTAGWVIALVMRFRMPTT